MNAFRWLPGVVMAAVTVVSPAWAQSPALAFIAINFPAQTGNTAAGGINNAGQVVGTFVFTNQADEHGFVDDHGKFTILDAPLASRRRTHANGINNRGEVVGTYFDNSGSHGFRWQGAFTTVDVPSALSTDALGVNDSGEIVGRYVFPLGVEHAFLFSGGRFTTIDPPGATAAIAHGINNLGQIVGTYTSSTGGHGFLYQDGQFTDIDLPFPGVEVMSVNGISDNGDVVGSYFAATGGHSFLKRGPTFSTIDVPAALVSGALHGQFGLGINAAGQIMGTFDDSRGPHVYLANPMPSGSTRVNNWVTFDPDPATYALEGRLCNLDPDGAVGELFRFLARLTVLDHGTEFSDAFIQVAALTPDRILAEVGGEGAFTPVPRIGQYADGLLMPGEFVDVTFGVCLPNHDPFTLFVDVWGRQQR